MTETPGPAPADQWWVLNGETFANALQRAAAGEDPALIYLEHIANSTIERPDNGTIPVHDQPGRIATDVHAEAETMIALDGYEPTDELMTAVQYGRVATEQVLIRLGLLQRCPDGGLAPGVRQAGDPT